MSIHTYQPPISTKDDLAEALNYFADSGHIILDRDNNVDGRFLLSDIKS